MPGGKEEKKGERKEREGEGMKEGGVKKRERRVGEIPPFETLLSKTIFIAIQRLLDGLLVVFFFKYILLRVLSFDLPLQEQHKNKEQEVMFTLEIYLRKSPNGSEIYISPRREYPFFYITFNL